MEARYCAWCRRWQREGEWVAPSLHEAAPLVASHTICPQCAERVARGESLGERHPSAAEAERMLQQGEDLERQVDELRGPDDPKDPGGD
jgi:hypothetical protein